MTKDEQRLNIANHVLTCALSELMDQCSLDHVNVNNDYGEWMVVKIDGNVIIEHLGKHTQ